MLGLPQRWVSLLGSRLRGLGLGRVLDLVLLLLVRIPAHKLNLQRSVVICVGLIHVRLEIVLVGDGRIAHGLARLLQPKALSELVEIRAVCRVTEMVGDRAAV